LSQKRSHKDRLEVTWANSAANTAPPSSRQPLREGINVSFAATDKFEKIQITVFARLADTQQNHIISDCSLGETPAGNIPQFRKCLDCVLGVVVVPRDTVVA
jgi:hypothetical protein